MPAPVTEVTEELLRSGKACILSSSTYTFPEDGEKEATLLITLEEPRGNSYSYESGWYYELSDRSILVKCPKPKKDSFEIVISTEKFDLIGMADD